MTTQTAHPTTSRISEDERVGRWRIEQLRRAGYPPRAASTIGAHRDVDLHLAIELVRRGCRPELALQILL